MRKIAIAGLFALILAGCGNPADSNITANPLPQAARVPAATQPLATAPDPAAADRPAPAQPDDTTIQQPPEPAPQPKPALPEVPAGEKKDDGLWFALPFERGQGSLRLARQNDLLRVDVHVRLPYYAGDAARDRGTVLDLILSVDGANGRRLLFYPSPAWQPGPEPLMFRSEATYNKTAGMARLTEQPSFGARADVKYWDEWKATLYVDLRLVVVPGSTPASVADSWRAALIAGNQAARLAFPQGLNDMNPGLTPERMVTFKFSDLPRLADADESPRESAIEDEKEQQDAMRALTAVTQKRDFGGLQKKTREYIKTWPDALWLRFLDYLVARVGYENDLPGVDSDFAGPMKAYLEACPGQSQVHLDYLAALVAQGKTAQADEHFAALLQSPLVRGNRTTEVMINVRHGATLAGNGELDAADAIVARFKDNETIAADKDLKTLYDGLVRAVASARAQWQDELAWRADDAKKTNPRLTVETTKGTFVIELFEDDAPNTTASMVELAKAGFYNGLSFHRFVPNFVIQGGCPKGDGTGDGGYRLQSEVSRRNHFRGMVGMACSGPRTNTEGSQFYVCLSNNQSVKNLSGKYVIVGRVIEGMDVVDKLRAGDKMTKVTASNLRDHEYKAKKIQ